MFSTASQVERFILFLLIKNSLLTIFITIYYAGLEIQGEIQMKKCVLCNEEYEPTGRNQKYCMSGCQRIASNKKHREWARANPEKIAEYNRRANMLQPNEYQIYKVLCPDGMIYIGTANSKPSHRVACQCNPRSKYKTKLAHHVTANGWTKEDLKLDILCYRTGKDIARVVENCFIKHFRTRYPDKVLNKNLNRVGDLGC